VTPVVAQLVRPPATELADVAAVFDQDRRDNGEPVTAMSFRDKAGRDQMTTHDGSDSSFDKLED
jgi:hypothetical protein